MDVFSVVFAAYLIGGLAFTSYVGWKESFQAMQKGLDNADPTGMVPLPFRVVIVMMVFSASICAWPIIIYLMYKQEDKR
jgi:hypothetical protein